MRENETEYSCLLHFLTALNREERRQKQESFFFTLPSSLGTEEGEKVCALRRETGVSQDERQKQRHSH